MIVFIINSIKSPAAELGSAGDGVFQLVEIFNVLFTQRRTIAQRNSDC
jgi:hypothetical protein